MYESLYVKIILLNREDIKIKKNVSKNKKCVI